MKNYYRPGLEIGWEISKQKKLPPKPCLICGKDVFYKKSTEDRRKYCSVSCKIIGAANAIRGKVRKRTGQYLICPTCEKTYYRTPSELVKRRTNYCSFECRKRSNYYLSVKRGENHPLWKGGINKTKGYIYVKSYNHPNRNSGDYVAQHRLVMEKYLGRYLLKTETVHHKNGIKDDNRIENLELVTRSPHNGYIECPHCNKQFLIR